MPQQRIDFVVAGAQKSGTTALRKFLQSHPEIGMVRGGGETHFFDVYPQAAALGDYESYHKKYSPDALAKVAGDFTPIYIYQKDCLPAIHSYNPDMKVIVILRDPAERAYSQWIMEVEKGNETRKFLPAILHEAKHFALHGQHPVFSYVQRGFYDAQIARMQALFPDENYLILRNEELRRAHASTLSRVVQFLGVSEMTMPSPETVHSREYRQMPKYLRRLLVCIFRKDIKRLERRLGWDCSDWLTA